MVVLPILIVNNVMMQEELRSVFNALLQAIEFLLFHNINAYAKKVFMMIMEFVNHVAQAALNALMPLFVKDVPSQPLTTPTELAHVLKAISSLLNH